MSEGPISLVHLLRELKRKIESADHVLQDIIDTSLTIAGITNLSRNELEAKVASSKASLLAAIILKDYNGEIPKFDPDRPLKDYLIYNPDFNLRTHMLYEQVRD